MNDVDTAIGRSFHGGYRGPRGAARRVCPIADGTEWVGQVVDGFNAGLGVQTPSKHHNKHGGHHGNSHSVCLQHRSPSLRTDSVDSTTY